MKKAISTDKAPAKNWTIFTGNRSKRYGIYIRSDPGSSVNRRDSGRCTAQADQAIGNLAKTVKRSRYFHRKRGKDNRIY